jgi:hypothetical protein
MSRSKTFAASLIAVLAIAGLAAAGAQALAFRANAFPVTLDGTGVKTEPTKFKFGEVEFTCESTTLSGTLEKEGPTLLIQRSYAQCLMKFGEGALVPATIKVNGCAFQLHLENEIVEDKFGANVDIVCEGAAGIEFFGYNSVASHEAGTPTCVFEISPQNGAKTVYLIDMTEEPFDITVQPTVVGLKYKRLKGILCGPETGTANYSGNTTMTGTKGGKVVPIWVQ